ncbi:MAG: leucine-rich repeat domain-containing protein [Clostridia bacterium]|nr:leucine-rich repeat domain-containing protein [Clostridia bacterium]
MLKRLFLLFTLALLFLSPALAAEEDWEFDPEYYFVTGYTGAEATVIMPDFLMNCPVEVLESVLLCDRPEIESLTLSGNLLDLRDGNIYNNENLKTVLLPDSLIIIGENNFVYCPMLEELVIPSRVSYIGAGCLRMCDSLTQVTFKGACPVFGPDCFDYVPEDLVVLAPDDQLEAYRAALPQVNVQPSGAQALTHDFTSDELNFLMDGAAITAYTGFDTRVDVPAVIDGVTVTAVGDLAFPASYYVTYITLPEGITRIGENAFGGMRQLQHITLPSTLKTIGDYAFDGFQGPAITLPEGLTHIGSNAFRSARLKGTLTLPASLESLSPDFMNNCVGIDRLVVKGDPMKLPQELKELYPYLEITVPEDADEAQRSKLNAYLAGAVPTLTITQQPQDVGGAAGEVVTLGTAAQGDGLAYAWYGRKMRDKDFTLLSEGSDTLHLTLDESLDNYQIYCVITDLYGQQAETSIALVSLRTPLTITRQPEDVTAPEGEYAQVRVECAGDGLTYAWYARGLSDEDYSLVEGADGPQCAIEMTTDTDCTQVYCLISDRHGQSIETERVILFMEAEEEPLEMPDPQPVGSQGEPFLGVWQGQTMEAEGFTMNFSDLGMVMEVTFYADGTLTFFDGETTETLPWTVVDGEADILGMSRLALDEEGRLIMAEEGARMIFTRQEEAAAPLDAAVSSPLGVKYVLTHAQMSGMTLTAEMLQSTGDYVIFKADGQVEMMLGGQLLPVEGWHEGSFEMNGETRQGYVVDFYGTPYNFARAGEALELDYYGMMVRVYAPEK